MPHRDFSHLLPASTVHNLITTWLHEDCPNFDPAGYLIGFSPTTAHLYLKSPATLAGRPFVDAVFTHLKCKVDWQPQTQDGTHYQDPRGSKRLLAIVRGPACNLLLGERVALNAYAECSAVATIASRVSRIAREKAWKGRVAGTRKTTPGFRLVQKYGMVVGGMDAHRMDLSSMVMLKDNHIKVCGGITEAVRQVREVVGFSLKVDVECADVEQALEAARAGADVVMLDNFGVERFVQGARTLKEEFGEGVLVEGSGGISARDVGEYMCEWADVLSFSVNRYVEAVDISLKVVDGTSDTLT